MHNFLDTLLFFSSLSSILSFFRSHKAAEERNDFAHIVILFYYSVQSNSLCDDENGKYKYKRISTWAHESIHISCACFHSNIHIIFFCLGYCHRMHVWTLYKVVFIIQIRFSTNFFFFPVFCVSSAFLLLCSSFFFLFFCQ